MHLNHFGGVKSRSNFVPPISYYGGVALELRRHHLCQFRDIRAVRKQYYWPCKTLIFMDHKLSRTYLQLVWLVFAGQRRSISWSADVCSHLAVRCRLDYRYSRDNTFRPILKGAILTLWVFRFKLYDSIKHYRWNWRQLQRKVFPTNITLHVFQYYICDYGLICMLFRTRIIFCKI